MRVLDLFSGIGGFSLGLERAGMETVAFCEIEPYCRAVLAKHWPAVPVFHDVRTISKPMLDMFGIEVDVICGGFPCQDISFAGKGAGLGGERSGLWSQYRRLIEEIRPRYAIIENVSALRSRGLDVVLGALAALGYDAEWHCIPAAAVGAPHRRDRVWIVAYTQQCESGERRNPDVQRRWANEAEQIGMGRRSELVADANIARLPFRELLAGIQSEPGCAPQGQDTAMGLGNWWRIEPDVGRVAHGIPSRVDRLRALGNAVVPQIPEVIGRVLRGQK